MEDKLYILSADRTYVGKIIGIVGNGAYYSVRWYKWGWGKESFVGTSPIKETTVLREEELPLKFLLYKPEDL